MELSAGRQTLNMKAFISTMAVVYVQQCELANLTDLFIGASFLLMLLFHVMITHSFCHSFNNTDLMDFLDAVIFVNLLSRDKHGLHAFATVPA